jgi:hypothetical protein
MSEIVKTDIISRLEADIIETVKSVPSIIASGNNESITSTLICLNKFAKDIEKARTETVRPFKEQIKSFENDINNLVRQADDAIIKLKKEQTRIDNEIRLKEEARQNFVAAAESSFVHYKETGLHITLDEFDSWVDQVQQDPSAPLPTCHK